jgi:hypothetical protein
VAQVIILLAVAEAILALKKYVPPTLLAEDGALLIKAFKPYLPILMHLIWQLNSDCKIALIFFLIFFFSFSFSLFPLSICDLFICSGA